MSGPSTHSWTMTRRCTREHPRRSASRFRERSRPHRARHRTIQHERLIGGLDDQWRRKAVEQGKVGRAAQCHRPGHDEPLLLSEVLEQRLVSQGAYDFRRGQADAVQRFDDLPVLGHTVDALIAGKDQHRPAGEPPGEVHERVDQLTAFEGGYAHVATVPGPARRAPRPVVEQIDRHAPPGQTANHAQAVQGALDHHDGHRRSCRRRDCGTHWVLRPFSPAILAALPARRSAGTEKRLKVRQKCSVTVS